MGSHTIVVFCMTIACRWIGEKGKRIKLVLKFKHFVAQIAHQIDRQSQNSGILHD